MHVLNELLTADRVKQNIFEKTLIEAYIPSLYASFGTFCVEIGQLFEVCLKIDESLSSKENVVDFGILPNV